MKTLSLTGVLLAQQIERKKKSFPAFSLRWLAKKLSVSPAYISQVIAGNRSLRPELLEPLCEILDMDAEKQELISMDLLRGQGWAQVPKKGSRGATIDSKAHSNRWASASKDDLAALLTWKNIVVLEATQLEEYDGTCEFLSVRLGMSLLDVDVALGVLNEAGYLKMKDGKLVKCSSLLEFQSRSEKKAIREMHKAVLSRAIKVLDTKTSDDDIEARLISSSTFTVSREHIPALRAKMAEFVREISIDSAEQAADELYQFSLAFFSVSQQ